MRTANVIFKRFSVLASAVVFISLGPIAQAQTDPNLFRQRPISTPPGRHGVAAHVGDIDETLLSSGAAVISLALPGRPDLRVELQAHERRGPRSMIWRGRGESDRSSKATLTLHEGLLYGQIQSGSDTYIVRPAANGRTMVEKIDSDSFAPEWGHDAATHGHDKVPTVTGAEMFP